MQVCTCIQLELAYTKNEVLAFPIYFLSMEK